MRFLFHDFATYLVVFACHRSRYAFFKMLLLAAQTYPALEPRIGAFIKGRAGETDVDGTVVQTRSDQVAGSRTSEHARAVCTVCSFYFAGS